MLSVGKKRILFAPLDWGLGHATRSIPIIYELLKADFEVIIAADGKTKALLQQEFPNLIFLTLQGYKIKYSKGKRLLFFKILAQTPKILLAIRHENRWLKQTISEQNIEFVLSDNRYGLYNSNVYCIFITHQLWIKTPFLPSLLQLLNYRFLQNFNEVWVPDDGQKPGIAGILSHPNKLPPTRLHYIGLLSRLNFQTSSNQDNHLLILLSGPEPQRTILEKTLMAQIKQYKKPVLLIRGLPDVHKEVSVQGSITIINHLPAAELEKAFAEASYIICRSGYSSVMDIIKMRKKSILIPTPGQTEQEYLATHLAKNNLAFSVKQENFDLLKALSDAENFPYRIYEADSTFLLQKAIQNLLVL